MAAHGGMGARWCPDCGQPLAEGAMVCSECGLEAGSAFAAELERANAAIHEVRERKAALEERERQWMSHRAALKAQAPRRAKGAAAAATTPVATHAPLGESPPADAPRAVYAAPAADQAPASRPAKRLTAPALLGISGAALLIASGVIFVAVSWSTYVPAVRMAVLVAFAAAFAWLARTLTKHDFATIGGALGVVSAGFVGVSVFALRWGPDGPGRFTFAAAALAAGIVGHFLAKLGIKATGMLGVAAILLAAEAAAVEAAWWDGSSSQAGPASPWATYAIVAAVGGLTVALAHGVWGERARRVTAEVGGFVVALGGAVAAVISLVAERGLTARPVVALAVAIASTAILSVRRPAWAAWAFAGVLVTGAMAVTGTAGGLAGTVVTAGATAALVLAWSARWMPTTWRAPVVAGLSPAVVAALWPLMLVTATVLASVAPSVAEGLVDTVGGVTGLAWHGVALVVVAAIEPAVRRWRVPPGGQGAPRSATLQTLAGVVAGCGLVGLAVAGSAAWGGLEVLSLPAVGAAAVWWAFAALWGGARQRITIAATVLLSLAGLHGALMTAGDLGPLAWPWAVVGAGAALLAVCAVAWRSDGVRQRLAAGAASIVFVALSAAVAWHLGPPEYALVAAGLAALAAVVVAGRLSAGLAGSVVTGAAPALSVVALFLVVGAVGETAIAVGVVDAGSTHSPWWVAALAAAFVVLGPALGAAVARDTGGKRSGWTAAVAGPALVACAVTAAAWTQRLIDAWFRADQFAGLGAHAAPAVAALAAAAFFAFTYVGPLRAAKTAAGIGGTAVVSLASAVGLGAVAFGRHDQLTWVAVAAVVVAAAALGVAARWYPAVTLAPAVLWASLAAPAWLVDAYPTEAGAAAALTGAVIVWVGYSLQPRWRRWVLIGGAGVGLAGAVALLSALSYVPMAVVGAVDGSDLPWRGWEALVVVSAAAALLAWQPARRRGAWVGVVTLGVVAGDVPLPVGWVVLAALGVAVVEPAARWSGKWSVRPALATTLVGLALAWTGLEQASVAVVLAALAVVALWAAIRVTPPKGERVAGLFITPFAASLATGIALLAWGVRGDVAAAAGAIVALGIPVVLLHLYLDSGDGGRSRIAPWTVGAATVVGPFLTGDAPLAAVVVLVASAAWLGVAAGGLRWARWVSLGLLTPAAALLMASLKVTTWEAYTAAPALTMVGIGLWWMRRDPAVRTYKALAPGLGLALVPSYIAMAVAPATWARPGSLLIAAVVLAAVGVWRKWFAPLVATATTAVAVALTQVFVPDPVVPQWAAITFIGAVLLGLGLAAERIRAMR